MMHKAPVRYMRIARAAAWVALCTLVGALTGYGQSPLGGCRVAAVDVRCGTVNVPEDRTTGSDSRTIGLRVLVLPAATPTSSLPLFVVNGGPGAATVGMAELFFNDFAALRKNRDIVLIDQRGTGGSHPLRCDAARGHAIVPENTQECLSQLSRIADLRFYGTEDVVQDLDVVRAKLGYDRIDVLGISYGTRVAWWYAKTFPARLRTVVMLSPNPPSQRLLESAGEDTRRALSHLAADCRANHECGMRFPRFDEELKAVSETLTPMERVALPLLLYSVDAVRRLPWMVNQAVSGDTRPLKASLASALTAGQRQVSLGLHLTTQCSEEFDVNRRVQDDRLSLALRDEYATGCRDWPRIPVPQGFREPFRSEARALVISGEWDPTTPPRWAEETARLFSKSRVEVISKGTHGLSDVGECLGSVVAQFLDGRPLKTRCLSSLGSRQYFVPRSSN